MIRFCAEPGSYASNASDHAGSFGQGSTRGGTAKHFPRPRGRKPLPSGGGRWAATTLFVRGEFLAVPLMVAIMGESREISPSDRPVSRIGSPHGHSPETANCLPSTLSVFWDSTEQAATTFSRIRTHVH